MTEAPTTMTAEPQTTSRATATLTQTDTTHNAKTPVGIRLFNPVLSGGCNFDNQGFCDLTIETDDPDSWLNTIPGNVTLGPSLDHTSSSTTGGYVALKNSCTQEVRAALITAMYVPNTEPLCMSFYYSMPGIGPSNGPINIYRKFNGKTRGTPISSIWYNSPRGWHSHRVALE